MIYASQLQTYEQYQAINSQTISNIPPLNSHSVSSKLLHPFPPNHYALLPHPSPFRSIFQTTSNPSCCQGLSSFPSYGYGQQMETFRHKRCSQRLLHVIFNNVQIQIKFKRRYNHFSMPLPSIRYVSTTASQPQDFAPFKILYNYRKTKLLRKMREERKQKMERHKLQQKKVADALRREKQSLINRSMFQADSQWEFCCQNFKQTEDSCLNDYSTLQEQLPAKSSRQIVLEAIATIPAAPKVGIYPQLLILARMRPISKGQQIKQQI